MMPGVSGQEVLVAPMTPVSRSTGKAPSIVFMAEATDVRLGRRPLD